MMPPNRSIFRMKKADRAVTEKRAAGFGRTQQKTDDRLMIVMGDQRADHDGSDAQRTIAVPADGRGRSYAKRLLTSA